MAVFFNVFGYRQIQHCPQRQKEPAIPAKAGISFAEGESAIPASPTIPLSPPPPRLIPAKAGISAAAKRREIVRLRRQFAPSAQRFLPSQEWD
ncbi:MAG: hypothetical protein ACR2QC_05505 [Gammaproteobacteria bacterium]